MYWYTLLHLKLDFYLFSILFNISNLFVNIYILNKKIIIYNYLLI